MSAPVKLEIETPVKDGKSNLSSSFVEATPRSFLSDSDEFAAAFQAFMTKENKEESTTILKEQQHSQMDSVERESLPQQKSLPQPHLQAAEEPQPVQNWIADLDEIVEQGISGLDDRMEGSFDLERESSPRIADIAFIHTEGEDDQSDAHNEDSPIDLMSVQRLNQGMFKFILSQEEKEKSESTEEGKMEKARNEFFTVQEEDGLGDSEEDGLPVDRAPPEPPELEESRNISTIPKIENLIPTPEKRNSDSSDSPALEPPQYEEPEVSPALVAFPGETQMYPPPTEGPDSEPVQSQFKSKGRPAPLEDPVSAVEEAKEIVQPVHLESTNPDVKSMVSPQVKYVSVDSSKFTFGPEHQEGRYQFGEDDSEEESQPRPSDATIVINKELPPVVQMSSGRVENRSVESPPPIARTNVVEIIEEQKMEPPKQPYRRKWSDGDPPVPRLNLEILKAAQPLVKKTTPLPPLQSSVDPLHPLTYSECLASFSPSELKNYLVSNPQPAKSRSCLQALLSCCNPDHSLISEKTKRDFEVLLALDKRPVGSQYIDTALMFTVWMSHFPENVANLDTCDWTKLGFRNRDPRSEASTLGFLQLLFLPTNSPILSKNLLQHSQNLKAPFQYAEECLQVKDMAVKIAKSGELSEIMEESKDVMGVFNQFYIGCLLSWFSVHQKNPRQVDWKALEMSVRKSQRQVIAQAKKYVY